MQFNSLYVKLKLNAVNLLRLSLQFFFGWRITTGTEYLGCGKNLGGDGKSYFVYKVELR